jgi:type 1 glutamine amidotransferase
VDGKRKRLPAWNALPKRTTPFEERTCTMPVVWSKHWGKGRVFYSALGHDPAEFDRYPAVFQMSLNGILWAGNAL